MLHRVDAMVGVVVVTSGFIRTPVVSSVLVDLIRIFVIMVAIVDRAPGILGMVEVEVNAIVSDPGERDDSVEALFCDIRKDSGGGGDDGSGMVYSDVYNVARFQDILNARHLFNAQNGYHSVDELL